MGAGYEIDLSDTGMVLSVHQYSGSTLCVQQVLDISSHCSFWAYEPGGTAAQVNYRTNNPLQEQPAGAMVSCVGFLLCLQSSLLPCV